MRWRLGIKRVDGPGFALNSAVDELLKKEFDKYREKKKPHPIMEKNGVDAIPFSHPDLGKWRHNFTGVQYLHEPTNMLIYGAIDDVWINPKRELYIVDYKSTSKKDGIDMDDGTKWKEGYKRQMEVYQWIMRHMGFDVNKIGYFVYVNGDKSPDEFNNTLRFEENLFPYNGDDSWVEKAIIDAHKCLKGNMAPKPSAECEWCSYREAALDVLQPRSTNDV